MWTGEASSGGVGKGVAGGDGRGVEALGLVRQLRHGDVDIGSVWRGRYGVVRRVVKGYEKVWQVC